MSWNSYDSIKSTWHQIKQSRGRNGEKDASVGIDGVTQSIFDKNLENNLREIERKLICFLPENTQVAYSFAALRTKTISNEPGKLREIHIPRIRDQIVFRIISNEIINIITQKNPNFLKTSPRAVVKRVIRAREAGKKYVLKTDIQNYYPSIPHEEVLQKLSELGVTNTLVYLVRKALRTPHRDRRKGKSADREQTRGTATGTSLSTVLGELYLSDLEEKFNGENIQFIRYLDDILVLSADKNILTDTLTKLTTELKKRGLQLSDSKTCLKSFDDGFEYLGFRFELNEVLISSNKSLKWIRTYQGITKRFVRLIDNTREQKLEILKQMITEINREISGVCGMQVPYYSLANDLAEFRELDRQIRETLGGVFRRLNQEMTGDFRLESAFTWAWKYKKNYRSAKSEAFNKFSDISVDHLATN